MLFFSWQCKETMWGLVQICDTRTGAHTVHQEPLAGFADALQRHVYVLLARQTVDAVIQGVGHGLGHLRTGTPGDTLRRGTADRRRPSSMVPLRPCGPLYSHHRRPGSKARQGQPGASATAVKEDGKGEPRKMASMWAGSSKLIELYTRV